MIPTSCASILLLAYRCDVDFCTKQNVLKRRSRLHKSDTKHPTRAKCRGVCGLPSVTRRQTRHRGERIFQAVGITSSGGFYFFCQKKHECQVLKVCEVGIRERITQESKKKASFP